MLKKALLVGAALMSIAATTYPIEPLGDYNHQVVIEYQDGGPPIQNLDGTQTLSLFFRAGPYKAEDCSRQLSAFLGWFRDAETQLNNTRTTQTRVKVVNGHCEVIQR